MMIRLHRQATTTPKIRAVLQASNEPASTLAKRYSISELTVSKWKKRDGVEDHSHIPHRLQTTLSPAQEVVAVFLRKTLFLPLDDPAGSCTIIPESRRISIWPRSLFTPAQDGEFT